MTRDHHREDLPNQDLPNNDTMPRLDRRDFLKGASVIAAMAVTGSTVIHTTEAWGLETKSLSADTMRSLVKIARDIFPHDRIADKFYALAVKTYDEKSVGDAKLRSLIERGVTDLDKAAKAKHGVPYASVGWEKDRVNLLHAIKSGPFFGKIRGDLVVSLYNQKEVWGLFGYEGESASKGGYVNRGFNDINWL